MLLEVHLFATLKDRAGTPAVSVELPDGASTATLVEALGVQYPRLAPALASAVVAVNQEFAFDDVVLSPGDEVALFPPVSGGTTDAPVERFAEVCLVSAEPLNLDALVASVTRPSTGGVCVFTGIVRGRTDPERVHGDQRELTTRLHYEAYAAMAEAKLHQVAAEIRARWPRVQGIAIVQRIGLLEVGEPTVAIAVAAGHRDQGIFEAARYGIDRLKEIVPVWKEEIGPELRSWVEGDYRPGPGDRAQPAGS